MSDGELQYVSFEQANRLKALGFDWLASCSYADGVLIETRADNHNAFLLHQCSAPTVALALKWLRDVKGMRFCVVCAECKVTSDGWFYTFLIHGTDVPNSKAFETYEESESALLDAVLDVLEKGVAT